MAKETPPQSQHNQPPQTVGRLARIYGLSRSTLLYYDRVGLLHPQGRAPGEYRQYGPEEVARLERVLKLRRAGMGVADIRRVLDGPDSRLKKALEQRLAELDAETAALREQQKMVARLLGSPQAESPPGSMDRKTWTDLLKASGFSEADMLRWHAAFEKNSPNNHQNFLEFLRIPAEEIKLIRAWSTDKRRMLEIRKISEHSLGLIFEHFEPVTGKSPGHDWPMNPMRLMEVRNMSQRFMELLFEIFEPMPRQGPGNTENTQKALAAVPNLPDHARILDVGCGNGASSQVLAEALKKRGATASGPNGSGVWAVDFYQPFLDTLQERMHRADLGDLLHPVCGDMAKLADSGFKPESFDLIWSEGAAYIMGFDNALIHWGEFLKPGGCVVISEMSWFVDPESNRNQNGEDMTDARAFWAESYPGMRGEAANEQAARQHGYAPLLRFRLPHQVWWDEFYAPLSRILDHMDKKYANDPEALAFLAVNRQEIDLHRKHGDAYGYTFYVLQKQEVQGM